MISLGQRQSDGRSFSGIRLGVGWTLLGMSNTVIIYDILVLQYFTVLHLPPDTFYFFSVTLLLPRCLEAWKWESTQTVKLFPSQIVWLQRHVPTLPLSDEVGVEFLGRRTTGVPKKTKRITVKKLKTQWTAQQTCLPSPMGPTHVECRWVHVPTDPQGENLHDTLDRVHMRCSYLWTILEAARTCVPWRHRRDQCCSTAEPYYQSHCPSAARPLALNCLVETWRAQAKDGIHPWSLEISRV